LPASSAAFDLIDPAVRPFAESTFFVRRPFSISGAIYGRDGAAIGLESDVKMRTIRFLVEAPDPDQRLATVFHALSLRLNDRFGIQRRTGRKSSVKEAVFRGFDDICAAVAVDDGEPVSIISPVAAFAPGAGGSLCPVGNRLTV
jgi:hypothetical protein